ncbi:DinB family protein [Massilia cavernae]|uniref:Damage-inducible protein DinB n=1 Tax=Massilia cavernae TaxID=2320864 RepID=A0A418XAB6_9BURK|nr:DinB family protein [Massilia cavernae]RJG09455.1 damage-inducible protein DinB [Massilia cavernae]
MCAHIVRMAEYNEWMNARLYEAAATLPEDEILADKGAFFGSLYGTLNHILLGDVIWLKRFATMADYPALDPVRAMPQPAGFDQRSGSFSELRALRASLDGIIRAWAGEIDEAELPRMLEHKSVAGLPFAREFGGSLMHFFNHQTHHRGQATTLLSQAGIDMGPTDLVMLVPNVAQA